jgi:hypothetical protein
MKSQAKKPIQSPMSCTGAVEAHLSSWERSEEIRILSGVE